MWPVTIFMKGELILENDSEFTTSFCRLMYALFNWWCFLELLVIWPPRSNIWSVIEANTGAAKECLVLLFRFILIPLIPPLFLIFLFSCSPQWYLPIAVPGMADFWQLKSPSLKACQTFWFVRYTADQRLYLIWSKLVKSLISYIECVKDIFFWPGMFLCKS